MAYLAPALPWLQLNLLSHKEEAVTREQFAAVYTKCLEAILSLRKAFISSSTHNPSFYQEGFLLNKSRIWNANSRDKNYCKAVHIKSAKERMQAEDVFISSFNSPRSVI